tara:strand:- start:4737 stop:5111 length:375 start_codon:yes stop_codon:yes gene_type:complete
MADWVDRQALLVNTGQDKALAIEVLEIFKGQVASWGQMLDPADEPERWADAAHTIKGAALGVGAAKLAEICKVAEARGRADPAPSRTEAAVLINDIRDGLLPTLDEVDRLRHEFARSNNFRTSL